jgi:hypothetical protein
VQPSSAFGVQWTAEMIFATIIGGIGTIEGPILGTAAACGACSTSTCTSACSRSATGYGTTPLLPAGAAPGNPPRAPKPGTKVHRFDMRQLWRLCPIT